MSQLIRITSAPGSVHGNSNLQPVEPRHDFDIRPATLEDFEWIDAMQKAESDKLGFLMKMAIEKRIEQGNVLVACGEGAEGTGAKGPSGNDTSSSAFHSAPRPLDPSAPAEAASPLGYCIAVDRYMKQDHVGQFIQLNVRPGVRRGLVGAALVQATFDKSAYGVKLYGLWCRQDLAANRFWEAMGFVPLAFRAAGVTNQKKNADPRKLIHIYWQKRIRVGDNQSPYWFPYETSGGMMAESRLVLPIPLDMHWTEAKPVVLPGAERRAEEARMIEAENAAKADEAAEVLKAKRKEAREAAKRAKAIAAGPKVIHGVEVFAGAARPVAGARRGVTDDAGEQAAGEVCGGSAD
jgi:hypothetical protein